jgi:hypothetical protein
MSLLGEASLFSLHSVGSFLFFAVGATPSVRFSARAAFPVTQSSIVVLHIVRCHSKSSFSGRSNHHIISSHCLSSAAPRRPSCWGSDFRCRPKHIAHGQCVFQTSWLMRERDPHGGRLLCSCMRGAGAGFAASAKQAAAGVCNVAAKEEKERRRRSL